MASPSYVLSEDFLLKDSIARIENLCNQVQKNLVKRPMIISQSKRYVMRVVTYAQGALGDDYITEKELDLTAAGDGQNATVLLTGITDTGRILNIESVVEPDDTLVLAGDDGVYDRKFKHDEFKKLQVNGEYNELTRHYYFTGGQRKLKLWIGEDLAYAAVDPTILLVYQREPWIGYSAADLNANDVFMDLPNIYIPYFEVGTAIACLKESGLRENQIPSTLRDESAETVMGLDNFIAAREERNMVKERDA